VNGNRERPTARFIKPGEMLAMDPSRIHRGPAGFFWLMGEGPKPNERRGENVMLVHVRGELEHHKSDIGAESYENILEKMRMAFAGQTFDDKGAVVEGERPAKVALCLDSPGGVVAGLNETQAALLRMKAAAKIPVIVFVNEMAASAAYALATVGDRIVCPRSAILGSVGVISTMISQARKNEADGYDVELITSGARKADGHLHAPISPEAVAAERVRVNKLAADFFAMVSKARGISVDTVERYQAGIFLGQDAVRARLADAVGSLDDAIGALPAPKHGSQAGGNETDRRLAARRGGAEVLLLAAVANEARRRT